MQPSIETPLFDPEMVYVECRNCGQPLIWEPGRTTALLAGAGIDISSVDATCLIVAERCPICRPDVHEFSLSVIRLPKQHAQDANNIREFLESVEAEIASDMGGNNLFRLKPSSGNA